MKTGYGSDINSKISCFAMDDMLSLLATDAPLKVVAYFGHIWYMDNHLTAMGAFKDRIGMRSDNFDAMANRKWRTSEICPYAANLAAVKYHCPNDAKVREKVKFFLNQKTLLLDWCDGASQKMKKKCLSVRM